MASIVIHEEDLSTVVYKNSEDQLDIRFDNSGNVQFEKTGQGMKGEVNLPTVPVSYTGHQIQGNTVTFTKSDGGQDTLQLPSTPVDVTVDNIDFTEDGKLRIELTNGETKETDFDSQLVVNALINATPQQKQALKPFFIDLIKGEEVQRLNGERKGYLIATE